MTNNPESAVEGLETDIDIDPVDSVDSDGGGESADSGGGFGGRLGPLSNTEPHSRIDEYSGIEITKPRATKHMERGLDKVTHAEGLPAWVDFTIALTIGMMATFSSGDSNGEESEENEDIEIQ
jgi:hypothetical protein